MHESIENLFRQTVADGLRAHGSRRTTEDELTDKILSDVARSRPGLPLGMTRAEVEGQLAEALARYVSWHLAVDRERVLTAIFGADDDGE